MVDLFSRVRPFQSTPPRGRRPSKGSTIYCLGDFNPRLREGGDPPVDVYTIVNDIFQSTPPRGRRLNAPAGLFRLEHFNPRLREGGDQISRVEAYHHPISIHASAREATQISRVEAYHHPISIHASAREATAVLTFFTIAELFQSTPPRGRRLIVFKWLY